MAAPIEVVDPHVHIWDVATGLYPRREESYLVADLLGDAGDEVRILKAVHVEAFATDGLAEARHVHALADSAPEGLPQGIVAYANLMAPDADARLGALAALPRIRGIRQALSLHVPHFGLPDIDLLNTPDWRRGIGLLARHNLTFDLQLRPDQMADAVSLVGQHPEVVFILNHTGWPKLRDFASWRTWREGIRALARLPNLRVKISGPGMYERAWTVESFRPYAFEALDAFGPERAMFASNFPVDRSAATYGRLWQAFATMVEDFSVDERAKLFRTTAERVYRI